MRLDFSGRGDVVSHSELRFLHSTLTTDLKPHESHFKYSLVTARPITVGLQLNVRIAQGYETAFLYESLTGTEGIFQHLPYQSL